MQSTGDIVTRLECSNNKEEDARLIAAAPDLLSELSDLLSYVEKWDNCAGVSKADFMRNGEGYFVAARAAIAKAKGESK